MWRFPVEASGVGPGPDPPFARLCRRGPGVPARQKPGVDDYRGVPGGEHFLREGLPEPIEVAVYYVVSEALTNAGCAYDSY